MKTMIGKYFAGELPSTDIAGINRHFKTLRGEHKSCLHFTGSKHRRTMLAEAISKSRGQLVFKPK